jgi:hypothetical protein
VNPLTGDILGNPGQKAPETPRKEYNPGILSIFGHTFLTAYSFQRVFPLEEGQLLSGDQNIIFSSISF